jgi:hypothetical protein
VKYKSSDGDLKANGLFAKVLTASELFADRGILY